MQASGATGWRRLFDAFGYSMSGFRACFRNEEAFRLEVYAVAVFVPLGLWLGENGVERALMAGVLLIVLLAELFNSAIESVVDRFGGEIHELSGRAKDIGSAAVLLAVVLAAAVWALVLAGRAS